MESACKKIALDANAVMILDTLVTNGHQAISKKNTQHNTLIF